MSDILWHWPESNFYVCDQATILNNEFENYIPKIMASWTLLPGANELIDIKSVDW